MREEKIFKKSFTFEQFSDELRIAGFLGAYKFWETLEKRYPSASAEELQEHAKGILRGIAALCVERMSNRNRGLTLEEQEAFNYCFEGWEKAI